MCVNYTPSNRDLLAAHFRATLQGEGEWPGEAWQDYLAPIIRRGRNLSREGILASYGMVPKAHLPSGARFTTMNCRAETIGELRSFAKFWRSAQLCLVPMLGFFEPNWETGKAQRWRIGMADDLPFAVAGIWREWAQADGTIIHAFSQITVNADDHPLMARFHRPGEEKRALVIVPESDYDAWLGCDNPELARTFLKLFPAERMAAQPAPLPPRKPKSGNDTLSLF